MKTLFRSKCSWTVLRCQAWAISLLALWMAVPVSATTYYQGLGLRFHSSTTPNNWIKFNPFNVMPTDAITIEFWVSTSFSSRAMISYAVTGSYDELLITDPNKLAVYFKGTKVIGTSTAINDLRWHHVAVSWSKTTGVMNLIVDGIQAGTKSGLTSPLTGNGSLVVGQDQDILAGGFVVNQALVGDVDELRVWSINRSEAEIRQDRNRLMNGTEPGLVACYRFDETDGTVRSTAPGAPDGQVSGVTRDVTGPMGAPLLGIPTTTNIGDGMATVNVAIKGDGTPTYYRYEYGPTTSFGSTTLLTRVDDDLNDTTAPAVLAGLEPLTKYYYWARGSNEHAETLSYSMSFTMPSPGAGSAVSFSGATSSYIRLNNMLPTPMTNITVEFWMRTTDTTKAGTPVSYAWKGEGNHFLIIDYRKFEISVRDRIALTTTTSANDGSWHHIAVTWSSDGNVCLYKDGLVAAQTINSAVKTALQQFTSSSSFVIGQEQDGDGPYTFDVNQAFKGDMDEFRVWSVARSAEEIANNRGRRLEGTEPGLVAYLRFDEGSGLAVANAASGSPVTATATGISWTNSGAEIWAPLVESLDADQLTVNSARLRARVNPDVASTGPGTTAYYEYGVTPGSLTFSSSTVGMGAGIAWQTNNVVITNLDSGVAYYYRPVVYNTYGTNYGSIRSFRTLVSGAGWPVASGDNRGNITAVKHAVGADGSVYLGGSFSGTVNLGGNSLTSAGTGLMVARVNAAGDWKWAIAMSDTASASINAITTDANGNLYVAGQYGGTLSVPGKSALVAAGSSQHLFLARINPVDGSVVWIQEAGANTASNSASIRGMATFGSSIYVCGHFTGSGVLFGGTNLSASMLNAFLGKLDSNGNWLWARGAGGGKDDIATAITADSDGNVYVTGEFGATTATFGTTTLTSAGQRDLFLAKLDSNGAWTFAVRAGGATDDRGTALAWAQDTGSLFLVGEFSGGGDYVGTPYSAFGSGTQMVVLKVSASTGISPSYYPVGSARNGSVSVSNGRVYVCGEFNTSLTLGMSTLTSSGDYDVFAARLNPDLAAITRWDWARSFGATGTERSGSITSDENVAFVSGTFQGGVPMGLVLMESANTSDLFVARLESDTGEFRYNLWTIGEPVSPPPTASDAGGKPLRQPQVTVLPNITTSDWVVYSPFDGKLFGLRPVSVRIKWFNSANVLDESGTEVVGRFIWPTNARIHIAGAPVELEPGIPGFAYKQLGLAFTTNSAVIDSSSYVFTANAPGYSIIRYIESTGDRNPLAHPNRYIVVRTVLRDDPEISTAEQPATLGVPIVPPGSIGHVDPEGKNGYVLFEKAPYDGNGPDAAYNRAARTGPIIPVNTIVPSGGEQSPITVAWYHTDAFGIGWPDRVAVYRVYEPTDPAKIIIASGEGAGPFGVDEFPKVSVYNQPDPTLAGYNPNEEHAFFAGNTLYALRDDLNSRVNPKASEPYVLVKYHPTGGDWAFRVFRVLAQNAANPFRLQGVAGEELPLPHPLDQLPLAPNNVGVFGPWFKDYNGRIYAANAGMNGSETNIVLRFHYPLQEGFFYDFDGRPGQDLLVGSFVPWLDRGTRTPVNVNYAISWPQGGVPVLRPGQSLSAAKDGLPALGDFAQASVLFDEGVARTGDTDGSLVRMFDPLGERVITDVAVPTGITLEFGQDGRQVFKDLPYFLQLRLRYDPVAKTLAFRGVLDESAAYGGPNNPLLLVNVMSPRERDRIKSLSANPGFKQAVDSLYNLTRNPRRLDLNNDGIPDLALLLGVRGTTTNSVGLGSGPLVNEEFGDGPKVLMSSYSAEGGYVTLVENNRAGLGAPVTLHVWHVEGEPYTGDLKVIAPANVFDERLTLRHGEAFGGEPQNLVFEWYRHTADPDFDPTTLPQVNAEGFITSSHGWESFVSAGPGVNDLTLGEGGSTGLDVLVDNWFICRYHATNATANTNWSAWVGAIGGDRAQFAEGWIKRVLAGINPFSARTTNFHQTATATFASMLQQAGGRFEGPIALNPSGDNLNQIGLIETYETVLQRGRQLSIDAAAPVNNSAANNALLLAAGKIADLYMLLGNEAYADAADPTIGFRTDGTGYGTLAPAIFAFQNQLDSLLEEELVLLRGRDDRAASVRSPSVYNRLFWNFTRDQGEVAYVQAYNITDQDGNGVVDASDAAIMYPQGHGDAWGHYLTAIQSYYKLLRNTNFTWVPRPEFILLAGNPVQVDYLDERKFARAAAARAKTGAEIVDLTYRSAYVDDPAGQWQGYKDTDTQRAWGLSEWAARAGQGAYFDWVTANALLPDEDPNPEHVGIQKVDRANVPEIYEIVAGYDTVQEQLDKADSGLNPLGLAKGVVPFDIDPSQVSAGKTHFDQIYDRAIAAMQNAVTVFNHANSLTTALRSQQDTQTEYAHNVDDQERDFKNRLIEIFGYPYAGDIGPGKTYPTSYDGPDLYHWQYVNTPQWDATTNNTSDVVTAYFKDIERLNDGGDFIQHKYYFPTDVTASDNRAELDHLNVIYPLDRSRQYYFQAPANWGTRRASGQLQSAISDMIQSQLRFDQAESDYSNLINRIDDQLDLLHAKYDLQKNIIQIRDQESLQSTIFNVEYALFKAEQAAAKGLAKITKNNAEIVLESIPKVVGTATDATAPVRGTIKSGAGVFSGIFDFLSEVAGAGAEGVQAVLGKVANQASLAIEAEGFNYEVKQQLKVIQDLVRAERPARLETVALAEKLVQQQQQVYSMLSRGQRLMEERITFRARSAAETQTARYQDMTFRIFRNDAIQKYRAQFDLAARYVYLAATAYDYETQLLGNRTGAGRSFLTDIVRHRSLGQVDGGLPIAGQNGLADPLARLGQNFAVLKGQLGFNNPQTETGRFSLRSELFRIGDAAGADWRAELQKRIVPDLWAIPEFRRYCRPFAPESAGPQPGLVIRFPTTVTFGLNYFGWPLGGGDSAYDPTQFATKVRSAGIWFTGYPGTGLSQTPRIFLVPVGADVLRAPDDYTLAIREWRVVDQKVPVPFPIGASSLNNETWIPMNDSLSDTFADIRRFSSFRAYHDSGAFNPSETITDSRLIGRSVWNTDWMLIIPGGTLLYDPNQGLDLFVNSVTDIKLFFQTYAYSGN